MESPHKKGKGKEKRTKKSTSARRGGPLFPFRSVGTDGQRCLGVELLV